MPAEKADGDVRTQARMADEDEEVPVADWDTHGDTDTEGVLSEVPVTPSSSFGLGDLSVEDDEDDAHKKPSEDLDKTMQKETAGVEVEVVQNALDTDLMDVAYVLCGLSQRHN